MSVPPMIVVEAVKKELERGLTKKEIFTKFVGGVPQMEGKSSAEVGQILDEMSLPDFVPILIHFIQQEMDSVHMRKRLPEFNSIDIAVNLIKTRKKILVLTGAGISTSCGIPDFRSANGVYSMLGTYALDDPQDLFSISYFRRNVKPFYDFARKLWPGTHKPAPTHRFIRCIEQSGNILRNYTQNIDTLEHVCGSRKVLQCHGSFATATCTRCKYKCNGDDIKDDIMNGMIPMCPRCQENPMPSLAENFAMNLPELQSVRATHGSRIAETEHDDEDLSDRVPQGPRDQQTRSVSSTFSNNSNEPDKKRMRVDSLASNNGPGSPHRGALKEVSSLSSPVLVSKASAADTSMPALDLPGGAASSASPTADVKLLASDADKEEASQPTMQPKDAPVSKQEVVDNNMLGEAPVSKQKAADKDTPEEADSSKAGSSGTDNVEATIDSTNEAKGVNPETTSGTNAENSTAEALNNEDKLNDDVARELNALPFIDEFFDKGIMKPDIVFFGEQLPPDFFNCIETDVDECDLLIVMGTSLKVAPVSRVIELVKDNVPQILINREVVARPHEFDIELLGNCDQVSLELSRRLGWDIVTDTSYGCKSEEVVTAEGSIKFTRSEDRPYRYLFDGHVVSNSVDSDDSGSDSESDDEVAGAASDDKASEAPKLTGDGSTEQSSTTETSASVQTADSASGGDISKGAEQATTVTESRTDSAE